jgi:hypothetical protein
MLRGGGIDDKGRGLGSAPQICEYRPAAFSSAALSDAPCGLVTGASYRRRHIQVMTDDSEAVAIRLTVVDGQRQEDDYELIWRGLPIGRIMKPPGDPHWWWGCNVPGQPVAANDRGPGINFKDCQTRFKIAWTRIRASLTEEDISLAARHAGNVAGQQSSNADGQPKTEELRSLEGNRAAPRQRILKAGSIEFSGSTIDCVVRNISATGAAIEVASPVGIPAEFNLVISGNIAKRPCRVVWVRDNRIGVAFRPA